MPKQVRLDLRPTQMIENDLFLFRNREWTMRSVDPKVKYATVKVDESVEPLTLLVDQTYLVKREVPTAQEQYESMVEFIEQEVAHEFLRKNDRWATALELLAEEKNPDHIDFERFIQAKGNHYTWSLFGRILRKMDGSEGASNQELVERASTGDLINAMEDLLKEESREVWGYGRSNPHGLWAMAQQRTEVDQKRQFCDYWMAKLAGLDVLNKKAEGDF